MSGKAFVLAHQQARDNCSAFAQTAPEGWRAVFSEPRRKDIQSDKFHAMMGDIAKQCYYHGRKLDLDSWKRLLVEAMVHILREEAMAQGKPDPFSHRGAVLPSLDGMRIVQIEVLTRHFTVSQASNFIEYLFSFGAERDVIWSEPKQQQAA